MMLLMHMLIMRVTMVMMFMILLRTRVYMQSAPETNRGGVKPWLTRPTRCQLPCNKTTFGPPKQGQNVETKPGRTES